ncbi:MAG TPA: hypothetical protein VGG03_02110 [Thermoanaerobaculia bacterium]
MVWNIGRLSRAVRPGACAALLISGMTGALAAQQVELVSRVDPSQVSDTGMGALPFAPEFDVSFPDTPSISDDGRYAVFVSRATNLVPGQRDVAPTAGGPGRDVFLQDLLTGTTSLVSRSLSGPNTTGNGDSLEAVLSGDGRYIAFTSQATDLAPGQPGGVFDSGREDLLLYDRVTETTLLVASNPFAFFTALSISADGRYIAFTSDAHDLVPGQQGPTPNVFLYDRVEKTFRLVSHTSTSATTGSNANANPRTLAVSADGRYVLFSSSATDLVPEPISVGSSFLYDQLSGAVTLIGPGEEAVMSAEGRYIAVKSFQSIYLYDRDTRTKTVLSVPTPGGDPFGPPAIAISDDGRFVALVSDADRLVPAQPGSGYQNLYVYDRISGAYTLASRKHGSSTVSGNWNAAPALSADGRFVAFVSREPDMVAGQTDSNGSWDLFLFDRSSGTTTLVSHARSSASTAGDAPSYAPGISADGTRIVFASSADDLVAGLMDLNGGMDIFAFETASASTTAVSRRASDLASLTPNALSTAQALSADGRFAAFESSATHLIAGQDDSNGATDIFLYDRARGATTLVSRAGSSPTRTSNGRSLNLAISADGRRVVFISNSTDLVPGVTQQGAAYDVFVFDRLLGRSYLIGRTRTTSVPGTVPSPSAQISPDGLWVAFASDAPDLVPGQQDAAGPATSDVFLWNWTTGNTLLVSHSTAGPLVAGNRGSFSPRLSADGRYVAFASAATNLVAGQIDNNGAPDLFLYDRTTGRTTLVSHAQGSAVTAGSIDPFDTQNSFSMSADGRFIAFGNTDGGVEPGVTYSLYLYDQTLGTNQRIAPYFSGSAPVVSGDGRYLAFLSAAELVPGLDPRGESQLYLYDRIAKTTSLVTRSVLQNSGGNDRTTSLAISTDGQYIAFASDATDLVSGQSDPSGPLSGPIQSNVFLFDRVAGTTILVSRPIPSSVVKGNSWTPLLSASGRQVAFTSTADLVEGDLNHGADAYLFSLDPAPVAGPDPEPGSGPGLPGPFVPCTLLDTRRAADAPALRSDVRRVLAVHGACGVPATARKVAVKVTVLQPSGKGNLRIYPGNAKPKDKPSATLRFQKGQTRAASYTLPLATNGAGTLALLPFVAGHGTVHVTLEVTGYE